MKARKECLGYPDPNEVLFQDQTSKTISKSQKVNARRSIKSESTTPLTAASTPNSSSASDSLSLVPNPAESVKTAAVCFFLEGMLVEPLSAGRNVGHLEFIPKLYLHAMPSSTLARTTDAMCLAAFSNFGKEEGEYSTQAFQAYGQAVTSLHADLKDAEKQLKNETLMSTLVMLVVESLLARDRAPSVQWSMHTLGAMKLLMRRGQTVFSDPVASRLFNVVRMFLVEGARARGELLPPFFANLAPLPPITPELQLGKCFAPVSDLRRRVLLLLTETGPKSVALLTDLISECQSVDQEALQWTAALPDSYLYEVAPNPAGVEPDFPFAQPRHQYKDSHNHRLWNANRCIRVYVNVLAYRCLQTLENLSGVEQSDEIAFCLQNVQRLANEICQSLPPQLMEGRPVPRFKTMSQIQRAVSAYFMLWPFYLARSLIMIPQIQRQWIRDWMVAISDHFQLRHAMVLVNAGDRNPSRPMFMSDWPDDAIENVWENTFMYGSGVV